MIIPALPPRSFPGSVRQVLIHVTGPHVRNVDPVAPVSRAHLLLARRLMIIRHSQATVHLTTITTTRFMSTSFLCSSCGRRTQTELVPHMHSSVVNFPLLARLLVPYTVIGRRRNPTLAITNRRNGTTTDACYHLIIALHMASS